MQAMERMFMSERLDEDEILTAWALRFDGYRHCEQTGWKDEDRIAVTDALTENLTIPSDRLRQFTLFFFLQRDLCKWDGETLPDTCQEWIAYRTLFLLTAFEDVPLEFQHESYREWKATWQPRTAECVSIVAHAHAEACNRWVGIWSKASASELDKKFVEAYELYNQERYLFENVHRNFHCWSKLTAFDFFSIVIWKANRAKSKIAKRLLGLHKGTLEEVVSQLGDDLRNAAEPRERMRVLIKDYGFQLPMASAILTVLWPEEFTVYDVRAHG